MVDTVVEAYFCTLHDQERAAAVYLRTVAPAFPLPPGEGPAPLPEPFELTAAEREFCETHFPPSSWASAEFDALLAECLDENAKLAPLRALLEQYMATVLEQSASDSESLGRLLETGRLEDSVDD